MDRIVLLSDGMGIEYDSEALAKLDSRNFTADRVEHDWERYGERTGWNNVSGYRLPHRVIEEPDGGEDSKPDERVRPRRIR